MFSWGSTLWPGLGACVRKREGGKAWWFPLSSPPRLFHWSLRRFSSQAGLCIGVAQVWVSTWIPLGCSCCVVSWRLLCTVIRLAAFLPPAFPYSLPNFGSLLSPSSPLSCFLFLNPLLALNSDLVSPGKLFQSSWPG